MTKTKRTAPDPEWVPMYRQGIPTSKIAAAASVNENGHVPPGHCRQARLQIVGVYLAWRFLSQVLDVR